MGLVTISTGSGGGTMADPKLIFAAALKANASRFVMCHNHPSGSVKPSRADEVLTQRIKQAGAFMELRLADHIIISREGYFSFGEEGLL